MTLGQGPQQETAIVAYNKRRAQLDRWKESDTERESLEIRNRPKRVKFADKCIFQAACASNDKNQVARMIHDGYDINAVDEDGITALHQACIEDNFEMVEFLLANGADVNISDNEGWTPLHAVATCCYVSITKLLLEHGANVVALNNDCSIPLDICKNDEIRELFIQEINGKGIDVKEARRGEEIKMMDDAKRWLANGRYDEGPHPLTGASALHVAACKGYIKVLDLLIKAGANVNCKDYDGWTPLHAAAHWGQKEGCEVLLENMCDMNIKNNCDQTALEVANINCVPVLEDFKRKHDVNKNIESAAVRATNALPLPPKKKSPKPVFDDDVTIVTNKSEERVASLEEEEAKEAGDTVGDLPSSDYDLMISPPQLPSSVDTTPTAPTVTDRRDVSEPSNVTTPTVVSELTKKAVTKSPSAPLPSTDSKVKSECSLVVVPSSMAGTSSASSSSQIGGHDSLAASSSSQPQSTTLSQPAVVTTTITAKPPTSPSLTVESTKSHEGDVQTQREASDDNALSWRRGGSLRTRTTPSPTEENTEDRGAVRRTRSAATADSGLKRAYSFESDSKFFTRLTNARNRVKALEVLSAEISSVVNHSLQNSSSTNESSTPELILSNQTNLNPVQSQTDTTSTNKVVLRRRDRDIQDPRAPRPNTVGHSANLQRPAGSTGRSGESGSVSPIMNSSGATTKIGPVSKFKQFLFKSFVPPVRDEESETQRKAHAKRVRETRRSTQGVTLEELKSAEQYVKNNQPNNNTTTQSAGAGDQTGNAALRKDDDSSVERRPSWRLRVDDQDRSKFSLEDTRSTPPGPGRTTGQVDASLGPTVNTSPSLRSKLNRSPVTVPSKGSGFEDAPSSWSKPPRPPDDDSISLDDKDSKNSSGAPGAILRKKKQKRRSTGVVQYPADGTDPESQHIVPTSDTEEVSSSRGSGFSSDVEQGSGDICRSENGVVSRINYKKLYEEILKENQMLKSRLSQTEEEITELKLKMDKFTVTPRIGVDDAEKREKRALERKLSEMEEELKETRHLRIENQKLRDENGALIRVISKLSK